MSTIRTVLAPAKEGQIERRTRRLATDLPKGFDPQITFIRHTYAPDLPQALVEQPERDHHRAYSAVKDETVEITDIDGVVRVVKIGALFTSASKACDKWAVEDGEI